MYKATYVNESCLSLCCTVERFGTVLHCTVLGRFRTIKNSANVATVVTSGDHRQHYAEQLYGDSVSTALDSGFDFPEVGKEARWLICRLVEQSESYFE